MAYLESDRVAIRRYLGFSSLFLQSDPRLESAITASQSGTDGGTRPDASLETQIKADVAACVAIDTAIAALRQTMGATSVGRRAVELDNARETARLKSEGSMYVARIARALDVSRYFDPYWNDIVEASRDTGLGAPFVRNPYGG